MPETFNLASCAIGAVLNTASGSCDISSEERMREIFEEAGIQNAQIWCGDASSIDEAFREAANHELDVLVVLGGDGTIRSAAQASRADGALLIPLPGGTMNMLPKALYGNQSWEDALRETLAHPTKKRISGGRIGEEQFFIAAIIGAPALWAEVREKLRDGNISDAVEKGKDAFATMFANKINYAFTGAATGTAEAVAVTCPLISEVLDENERAFEAAAIDVNHAGEVLGLATAAAFGAWREDRSVSVVSTKEVQITSDSDIPVLLDGESVQGGNSLTVSFTPHAFTALVPESV